MASSSTTSSTAAAPAASDSLPDKIAGFVDKNGDTLQQMALLAYLKRGEQAQPFLEAVTTAKVAVDLYRRVSAPDAGIEAARAEAILNVSKYVKAHPRARPSELQQVVEQEVEAFKNKIRNL